MKAKEISVLSSCCSWGRGCPLPDGHQDPKSVPMVASLPFCERNYSVMSSAADPPQRARQECNYYSELHLKHKYFH